VQGRDGAGRSVVLRFGLALTKKSNCRDSYGRPAGGPDVVRPAPGPRGLCPVRAVRGRTGARRWGRWAGPLTVGWRSGAGFTFGRRVVARFCEVNQVEHILRAHQLCQEGYQVRLALVACGCRWT
jgi:hypothetical protein